MMKCSTKSYLLTNQNSTAFWLIDNLWMPLATSSLTGNQFTLLEQVCGTGIGGPPTHMHPTDEGMYILEGHCTYQVEGRTVKAGPGTFVSIPRETEHSFVVDKPNTILLNFYTPAGFEGIIMSLAVPAAERKAPVPGSTPMPPRWMVEETSREFGQIPGINLPLADPPNETNMATKPSQTNPTKPYALSREQAAGYWLQDILWTVLATAEQTGGSYSLLEQLCPKNSGPALHAHEQDEAFYVLEGEITLIAGPERFIAKAGSFIYIPAQCVHSFRVDTAEARLLNWYLPGGFERTITDFAVPAESRTLPSGHVGMRGTPEQLQALFKRVGMTSLAVPDFLRDEK